jgi:hypothetical protein
MAKDAKRRTERFQVRLSPDELRLLRLKADVAAVEVSTFVRALILDGPIPRRARRVSVDHVAHARAMAEYCRQGTNLNQAVKLAHIHGDLVTLRSVQQLIDGNNRLAAMFRAAMHP